MNLGRRTPVPSKRGSGHNQVCKNQIGSTQPQRGEKTHEIEQPQREAEAMVHHLRASERPGLNRTRHQLEPLIPSLLVYSIAD